MYVITSLDKARNHPDMMERALQDQMSWNKEQPIRLWHSIQPRNLSMLGLCKEEVFAGGLWWKEQYKANALTEVQAVVVRTVKLLQHETV